jgi:hypothetical protein
MVEIIVRFESLPGVAEASDDAVYGSVVLPGGPDRAPIRFTGWLQLLGILENLSSMTDESPEPPRPLPGARNR